MSIPTAGQTLQVIETTPQLGHADAVSAAVTTVTTRPPNASDSDPLDRNLRPARREAVLNQSVFVTGPSFVKRTVVLSIAPIKKATIETATS